VKTSFIKYVEHVKQTLKKSTELATSSSKNSPSRQKIKYDTKAIIGSCLSGTWQKIAAIQLMVSNY